MDKKPEKLVVIVQESVIKSLIKDAGTSLLFAGLLYFNHAVLNGSTFIDVLFIIFVFAYLITKASKYCYSGPIDGAIKWLQDKK